MGKKRCHHPESAREDGPRIPVRWGSRPTEICSRCGKWRQAQQVLVPFRKKWLKPPIPMEEQDDG